MQKRYQILVLLFVLFSSAIPALAQLSTPEKICVGTARHYWLNGMIGSTYTWKIDGVMQGSTNNSINITWMDAGEHKLEVQEHQSFCSGEILSQSVTVYDPPLAFAGNPLNICSGSGVTLSEAAAQNFSTLLWTSVGDGAFDDATLLHPTYTPGTNDLQSGTVNLTFTAEGLGNNATCAPAVSTVKLTVIKLEAVVTSTDVTCFGAKNGIITISGPSGGSGSFEYNIGTGWTASTAYYNLTPGIYKVQMRDVLFPVCLVTLDELEIKEPDPLSASVEYTDASCLGNDGTISVIDPKGGSGSYEYALNGTLWTTSGYYTQLTPGTYIVRISDANVPDCKAIVSIVTINRPEPLTAKVTHTNVTCFAGNDGSITVSDPKNGSGDYQFSIDGNTWLSGLVFSNLTAGVYTVKMRDIKAVACVETIAGIIITAPEKLQATTSSTNVSCYGNKDGSISILNPKGGSGSYEFTIDGLTWLKTVNFTTLGAGTYNVLIRDLNVPSCVETVAAIIITEPPQLAAVINSKDITCYGANDGTLTISDPRNGVPGYQYSIDGTVWSGNPSFTGLGPNIYIVQMRDSKGCRENIGTVQIVEPLPLNADIAWTNATCLGNDGTITVTNPLNSQSGLYEYNIDGNNWFAGGLFTGLTANTYIVRLRDAKLITCERIVKAVTVASPEPLLASAGKTNVTCFGANDGTITVTDQKGGSGLYEYSVDGTNWSEQSKFTGLAPASYTLQMRDAKAPVCLITVGNYNITQPELLSATVTPVDLTCYEGHDGSISITNPKGGSGSYEYSVNGTEWVSGNPNNLIAGTYTVQIRDAAARNCVVTLIPVEVKQPEKLTATVVPSNVTCFGGSDGFITITKPANGKEPYQYSLDGGITWQADGTFFGLKANTYSLVIIQDANNCSAPLEAVVISEPAKLEALATGTNETLPGANDGKITISGQKGGSGEYEYSMDGTDWQLAPVFTGLAPKTYQVQVRDVHAKGCLISLSVSVLPAGSITAEFTHSDITCYGSNEGSIIFANATGATNYEYSITGGLVWQSNEYFGGLTAQTYSLMVRDAGLPANSSVVGTVEISQPAVMEAIITVANETYAGASDGIISVNTIAGGSGVFEYSIDGTNWLSTKVFTGLTSDTYDIRIRDKNSTGCSISVQKVIQPAGSLSADVSNTTVTCNGSKSGSITISNTSGGSGNFEFSINNGVTWQPSGNYTGLAAGTYDVMLRDANNIGNKIFLGKVNINQPERLIASLYNFTEPLCAGGSGTFLISASGGIPPYKGTGEYSVPAGATKKFIITDTNGCTAEITILMPDPEKIIASGVEIPPICFDGDGTVTITAKGGTGTLSGIGTFKVQAGKNYSFKVTDKNGCQSNIISGQMSQGSGKIVVTVTPVGSLCSGGNTTVTVSASDGTSPYTGTGTFDITEGIHTFTVTDANGCSSVGSIDVTPKAPPLAPTVGVTVMPTCDKPFGTIEINSPLGANYTYNIDGGVYQASAVFANLLPGSDHAFRVKDITIGCESLPVAKTMVGISGSPDAPVAQVSVKPTCGNPTGTIEVTSPLGANYTYSIDGGVYQTSTVFANLLPGSDHAFRVKDIAIGCESLPVSKTMVGISGSPDAPVAQVSVKPTCDKPTGTIEITSPLGANYTYSIDGGPYQASTVFANLLPGSINAIKAKDITTGCESLPVSKTMVGISGSPDAPVADVSVKPTCGNPTGTIEVTSPLGANYTYSIDGGPYQASTVFANLLPGSDHAFRVKDITIGCESLPASKTMVGLSGSPDAPVADVSVKPTCDNPTGTIKVTSPLGANYTYSIDGGVYQASTVFTSLNPESIHRIKVKDISAGCESLEKAITVDPISANPTVPLAIVAKVPTCNNLNGTVEITHPLGVHYSYSIDAGVTYQTTPIFSNLKTGKYVLRVKDMITGCVSDLGNIEVPAIPPSPVIMVTGVTDSKCFGGSGTISLTVSNAPDGDYSLKYEGGKFNLTLQNGQATIAALAGTYQDLTIVANGCISDKGVSATVSQPDPIVIAPTITEIDLKSQTKGSIDLAVTGGNPDYQYIWHPETSIGFAGATGSKISNLNNGLYRVTVTDANGCQSEKTITLPPPDYPPVAVNDDFTATCNGVTGNLLSNDTDPENDPIYLMLTLARNPSHGTLTLNPDQSGVFEYVSARGYSGIDTFRYVISDSKQNVSNAALVTIHIIADFDGDGIPDDIDLDADGDGILNVDEVLAGQDWKTADSDGDGHPNYLDIDSDNDGIVDNVEAQVTGKVIEPTGIVNQSGPLIGVDYAFDPAHGGQKLVPVDTDKDGIPDFLDADSDNDGVPDYIEGNDPNHDGKPEYVLNGIDSDGDGLDDGFDILDKCASMANNMTRKGSDSSLQDTDGDGIPDWRDNNDDGDKWLTMYEDWNGDGDFSNDDSNRNGVPDYLDPLSDCELFIPDAFSPNGDNIHDYFMIYCMQNYPHASMYIFDHQGNKIYEKRDYGNLDTWHTPDQAWWDGKTTNRKIATSTGMVERGTYFYVLRLGNGEVRKSYVFVYY